MNTLLFLILFPLAISILILFLPHGLVINKIIGVCANAVLCAATICLLIAGLKTGPAYFRLESPFIDNGMLVVELLIAAYIVYLSVRSKRYLPILLVIIQSLIM